MPFRIITDVGIPAFFSGIEKPNHAGIAAIEQPIKLHFDKTFLLM